MDDHNALTIELPLSQNTKQDEFAEKARENQPGILAEFVDFLKHNKKWWLSPILIVLLILSVFVVLTSSPAAPFIYSFF